MGRRTRELILVAGLCGIAAWGLSKPVYRAFVLDPALRRATARYDVLAVRQLALQGANVNVGPGSANADRSTAPLKFTPLQLAVRWGDLETLRVLLGKGANPESRNRYGRTALMEAAINGQVPVVEALLKGGAKIDTPDSSGATALTHIVDHYTPATKAETIATVKALLRLGADPHVAPGYYTALARAEEQGATKLAGVLRKTGCADLNTCVEKIAAKGPLYAVRSGRLTAVKRLVRRNVSFRVRDAEGTTLTAAAEDWTGAMLPYLLKHARGIDRAFLNEPCDEGSALTVAARAGHWANIKPLLAAGADPNVADRHSQQTPLHYAAMRNNTAVVRLLLKAGADVNAKDYSGKTTLQWAKEEKNKPMQALLSSTTAVR